MTRRRGGWTKITRNKLSAILVPHASDPPDFLLTAAQAWSLLGGDGAPPTRLNPVDELRREGGQHQSKGISWRTTTGRIFSNEPFNALVALWTQVEGLPWVVRLLLDEDAQVRWPFYVTDHLSFFAALRRQVVAANERDFQAAWALVAPMLEQLDARRDDLPEGYLYWGLLLAFSRHPTALHDAIRTFFQDHRPPSYRMGIACCCGDKELALQIFQWSNLSCSDGDLYHLYDLIESLGSDSIPLIEMLKPYRSTGKKRVASALKLAHKLKTLGY